MTTNHLNMHRLVIAVIVSSSLLIAASASGQLITHQSGLPVHRVRVARDAQVPSPCSGRCEYCVDGQCVPRQETFGFYQTQWRRWPIEAPEVVKPRRPKVAKPELGPPAEVPAPHSEADVNPEFPHLRRARPESGAPGAPGGPSSGTLPPSPSPLPSTTPSVPPIDDDNPFRDDDLGMLRSTAPASPQLSPSASTVLQRAVIRADYSQHVPNPPTKAIVSSSLDPRPTNPERIDATAGRNPLRATPQRVAAPAVRPVPLPKPTPRTPVSASQTVNPLRSK